VLERRTFNNATTNGETEFDCVVKKMLPNQQGIALGELLPGQSVDVPFSYAFPATNTVESPDSLYVAVLVQDAATREVLQSAVARINGTLGVPVAAAVAPTALTLVPNPAPDGHATALLTLATAASAELTVLDVLGRVVWVAPAQKFPAGSHAVPLDMHAVPPGLYLVRLTVDGQPITRRLVVE
jgi:hypothetical protein